MKFYPTRSNPKFTKDCPLEFFPRGYQDGTSSIFMVIRIISRISGSFCDHQILQGKLRSPPWDSWSISKEIKGNTNGSGSKILLAFQGKPSGWASCKFQHQPRGGEWGRDGEKVTLFRPARRSDTWWTSNVRKRGEF